MDDLDGILAVKLDIKSNLGALLDNVCDAISHTMIMMVVGRHYLEAAEHSYLGAACMAACLLARSFATSASTAPGTPSPSANASALARCSALLVGIGTGHLWKT